MTERIAQGLYDPAFERDSCGFGLIANLDDMPSHWVVETAISALARLTCRHGVPQPGFDTCRNST
jgi:glutamate synthase (NADPH/NADH) large chain